MTDAPELKPSIYLRKRDRDHPFWEFARVRDEVPFSLKQLADCERVLLNQEWAHHLLTYLSRYFDPEEMLAVLVDYDGDPVSVSP